MIVFRDVDVLSLQGPGDDFQKMGLALCNIPMGQGSLMPLFNVIPKGLIL